MKPLGTNVFILPVDEKISEYIEVKNTEKPVRGTVIAIGKDVKTVAARDEIIFSKHRATELFINGERILMVAEEYIHATIKN